MAGRNTFGIGVTALLASLAGCASFDGMPEPVIETKTVVGMATGAHYGPEAALEQDRASTDTSDRQRRRDSFIAIQLSAIDARYGEFRRRLSRQVKAGNFGLELGVLALTSAGSIAGQRLANILSAGGAGLTGTKAALNKEVYFERTLPALLAAMDTRRLTVKTQIIEKMRAKGAADYTLAEAIADLSAYERAASLDGAIEDVTSAAAGEKQVAEDKYDAVAKTCRPEKGIGDEWEILVDGLDSIPESEEARLDTISGLVGTSTAPAFEDQKEAIIDRINVAYCSIASVRDLREKIHGMAGVTFR